MCVAAIHLWLLLLAVALQLPSAAAAATVVVSSEDGTVYTIKAGPEFELIAQNEMKDICMASPAISDGVLYVRTKSHLYAIGQPKPHSSNLPCPCLLYTSDAADE